jgi:hypothetical protein
MAAHRHIRKDNTEVDLQEAGWEAIDWIIWLRIRKGGGLL